MIIGTAGHIDHGKSALVEALTGRRMDRLAEERRRGITIDLNFAPFALGDGTLAGVVDVPGHEDFVRTMVAGASGIDLVLLVVAADEALMPQSLEHLAIVEQLGIRAGIPVVTKADLVEPEWAELVALEVAERVKGSPVRFAAPCVVSARRGDGLDELRRRIAEAAATLAGRSRDDAFRLPVDRVFSVSGVGTVLTGTAWSGTLAVGDSVILLPGGREARVRTLESFGRPVERSEPGARTAVGLVGVERDEVRRGDVLVTRALPWTPATALDAVVELVPDAPRPLVSRTRVHLHLGTAELLARVYPLAPIVPGSRGLARLALEAPLAARGGDRFVIRSYSPVHTIGGGRVVDPIPPRRRAAWPPELAAEDPTPRLSALLARRPSGVAAAALPLLLGLPPNEAAGLVRAHPGLRPLEEHLVPEDSVAPVREEVLARIREHHRTHPSDPGISAETLRRSLRSAPWIARAAIDDLVRARRIEPSDGVIRLAGFRPTVTGGSAAVERIIRLLEEAGLAPPSVPELAEIVGRDDLAAVLRIAAGQQRVVMVQRDRYWAASALEEFVRVVREIGGAGEITPAALRDRLGLSRKYLIPLLEWSDTVGLTVRTGDVRVLRRPGSPSAT